MAWEMTPPDPDEIPLPPPRAQRVLWLVTFGDMISLVLTFFVMLFAMSQLDLNKWKLLASELGKETHPQTKRLDSFARAKPEFPGKYMGHAVDLDYLALLLQRQIDTNPAYHNVFVEAHDDKLILVLPADAFFASGQARLDPRGVAAISEIAQSFSYIRNQVRVEGNTDPAPTTGTPFTSNWELSIARAAAVAAVLKTAGYSKPLEIMGRADAGAATIDQNLDKNTRFRLARRVDIVIYPTIAAQ